MLKQLENFNWKTLIQKELDYVFKDIKFKIVPRWHQFVSIAFAADKNRVMFLEGVGTGKTLCALFTTQIWNCKKILVICPSSAFGAWRRDIPLGTDYSFTFLTGSRKERYSKIKKKSDVYIVNYEGLKVLYGRLIKDKGWKIDYTAFADNFDCIIIDEAHRCNNYSSLQTKLCYELSKRVKFVIGMTGTAIDKSMLELFNTYKVIDLGASLGLNYFLYRRLYFYPAFFDWKPKDGAKEKIMDKVSNCTISFDREECIDLPELDEIELPVSVTKEFLDLQHKVIDGHSIIIDDIEVENLNETTQAQRLRQLSDGFFYYKDNGVDKTFYLKENPKIEALLDLTLDTKSKILVFYQFTAERKLIEDTLRKNKVNFVSVYGTQKFDEREKVIKDFQENQNVQIMLAQTSISEGYDATAATTVVFTIPVSSPKIRAQCIGRIYRSGQKKKCLAIDLVLESSSDRRIIKDRGERFNLVESFRKYMQEYHEIGEV